jgi:hypothetical protein
VALGALLRADERGARNAGRNNQRAVDGNARDQQQPPSGDAAVEELPRCAAVLAVGEPLNYVEAGAAAAREASLPPFFRKVAAALQPGGLFAFDVIVRGKPSLTRARRLGGKGYEVFVTTRDEGAVLWRDVVCFARRPGQRGYARSHELHRVRVLQTRVLLRQLRAAGFKVKISRGYGAHRLPVRRLAFICSR